MIYLFTDFGYQGPYVGELHAVFAAHLPNVPVVDLMHDAPMFDPRAGSYLLAALSRRFHTGDLCLGIVDPGVGSGQRRPLLVEADNILYCGPDNGLFSQLVQNAKQVHCHEILWPPPELSDSFHGRDLFAPALAMAANGETVQTREIPVTDLVGMDWPRQLHEVIYIDRFGNAVLGIQADAFDISAVVEVNTSRITYTRTFAQAKPGDVFWYENSMGLVELAMNQGSASEKLGLTVGATVSVTDKNV